jgi:hypothetical protein
MYLLVSTAGHLTERELQRELGVAQKTASRMRHQILPLLSMADASGATLAPAAI